MRKFVLPVVAILVGIFAITLTAAPASAQATRTWVSGVGDDANPCSRTAPCKTFAGSISKTAAGGEINCLDSGGFGTLTITKSISIICNGVIGGVLASGTVGMTVSAPGARVLLQGLDFEGVGSGTTGVSIVNAQQVTIVGCTIQGFTGNGVNMTAAAGTPVPRVSVQSSLITGNGGGINVLGSGGATNNAEVSSTIIDSNTTFGIQVAGPGTLVLSASTVTGNATGLIVSGGGNITSYGNNVLRNGGTPTTTLPLQ
jgi:hypothetical protein